LRNVKLKQGIDNPLTPAFTFAWTNLLTDRQQTSSLKIPICLFFVHASPSQQWRRLADL